MWEGDSPRSLNRIRLIKLGSLGPILLLSSFWFGYRLLLSLQARMLLGFLPFNCVE